MPGKKQDVQDKFQQLRQEYAAKLPDRITTLEQQWQALDLANPDSAKFETLIREFHKLAGSGTSYGFPQVTALSREIETILLDTKSTSEQDVELLKAKITTRLTNLKQSAADDPVG